VSALWPLIGADLKRYGRSRSWRDLSQQYWLAPGFRYTFWLRVAAFLKQRKGLARIGYVLSRWMLWRCGLRFGIDIPYNTQVGPGLYIGHYGGIVVSHEAVIGADCNINHQVTIGVKCGGKNAGTPIIGDRVFLGPGCKVIGGITIGNDVAIGANAVVLEPIPDSSVVVGVPAHVVSNNGSSSYVVNTNTR
jgi:serine O-acetyltransferase